MVGCGIIVMMKTVKHEKITREFIKLVEKDQNLKGLVEKSLALAKKNNPDKTTNPAQSLEELYQFLDWAVKCDPWQVLKEPKYSSLFQAMDQTTGYFWYLFDQPLDQLKGKGFYYPSLQYLEPIASWIKRFSKAWGKFLSSKKSWSKTRCELLRKDQSFGLDKGWYEDEKNWKTFNQFFSRKLSSSAARPIAQCSVVAPADSQPMGFYQIDDESNLVHKDVNLKSAKLSSIEQLLGGGEFAKAFAGGTMTHTFLAMNDYHRYHFPVSGKIVQIKKIAGAGAGGGITEWDKRLKKYVYFNETGFQMIEQRACVIVQTEKFGLVAILPIGMSQVCSVNFEKGLRKGRFVKKGDPMGFFLFGGSDVVMIFQKNVSVKPLVKKTNGQFEHVLMGQPYAQLELKV